MKRGKQTPEHIAKRIESRKRNNPGYYRPGYIAWNKGKTKETDERIAAYARKAIKGRKFHSRGYVMVYEPLHPSCDRHGYMFEHILILEKKLGRYLYAHEECHHLNEIKSDNRPENLVALTKGDHTRLHGSGRKWSSDRLWKMRKGQEFACEKCGKVFYRARSRINGPRTKHKYCSIKCANGRSN